MEYVYAFAVGILCIYLILWVIEKLSDWVTRNKLPP